MMRFLFGALLGVLVACPGLRDVLLTAAGTGLSQPPVLAVLGGVLTWPRIVRTARRWTS
ncbi:hypothetical protein [Streptomyces sp. NPDC017941]|uniref:hypothetical protein n=1 Tax=Streptomyces sp. NPDC017941 TaxID=3365018 RepID=UPI0037A3B90E